MRIEHFSYHNKTLDWKVETTFFPNLTLLVGISGVGKTEILNAIWRVKEIANGRSSDGAKWDITFVATNGTRYFWSGEYESRSISEEKDFFSGVRYFFGVEGKSTFSSEEENSISRIFDKEADDISS
ncbi:MAG: ATP-binding protein, partial [Acidobacteriota bacterium]